MSSFSNEAAQHPLFAGNPLQIVAKDMGFDCKACLFSLCYRGRLFGGRSAIITGVQWSAIVFCALWQSSAAFDGGPSDHVPARLC